MYGGAVMKRPSDDELEAMAVRLETAKHERDYAQDVADRDHARAEALDAKLKEAVEVLKWYGCQKNWTTEDPYEECGIDLDEGSRARAFLASIGENQ